MSRRRTSPLKPQLNQIRTWTQQGRTDAWMAHKLETSPDIVAEFRAEYGISRGGGGGTATALEPITPELVAEQALEGFEPSASLDDEPPAPRRRSRRRAASEEPAAEEAAPTAPAPRRRRRAASEPVPEAPAPAATAAVEQPAAPEPADEDAGERPSRRRSRRRRGTGDEAEAVVAASTPVAPAPAAAPVTTAARGVPATLRRTIEIALDASVLDDPVFREHWLGVDGVVVEVRRDELVLRRAG